MKLTKLHKKIIITVLTFYHLGLLLGTMYGYASVVISISVSTMGIVLYIITQKDGLQPSDGSDEDDEGIG